MTVTNRVSDRSPTVQRSRLRSEQQQRLVIEAAQRLIETRGAAFTTQELVKEAGIALQTFYRQFAGKDQLLLAVMEQTVSEGVAAIEARAAHLDDPLERLRAYITAAVESVTPAIETGGARFITAEHWRLSQLFPEEMTEAVRPFARAVERELRRAVERGQLRTRDPERAAWFTTNLVMSVFHHDAFAPAALRVPDMAEHLWSFCLVGFDAVEGSPT